MRPCAPISPLAFACAERWQVETQLAESLRSMRRMTVSSQSETSRESSRQAFVT